jgi:hypothetical protein
MIIFFKVDSNFVVGQLNQLLPGFYWSKVKWALFINLNVRISV